MLLTKLFKDVDYRLLGQDLNITGLKYDSRKVEPGDLFFCISGFEKDGHSYVESAVNNGAVAVMVTRELEGLNVPQIVVKNDRKAMAISSAAFYKNPASRMKVIGVTGTNGKTTTTYMIKKVLEQNGYKVGLIGTIKNMIGNQTLVTERTTPESVDLHKLFMKMEDEGCEFVVMEVSSHSLALDRVYGVPFSLGIFTNITQDHMDFHKTWDNYIAAKSILCTQSDITVINADDSQADKMAKASKGTVIKYGVSNSNEYTADDVRLGVDNVNYVLAGGQSPMDVSVPIPGLFTVYNSMATAVACEALGIEPIIIKTALKNMVPVTGRFEVLTEKQHPFTLILDYAHTPDSLENALITIKEFAPAKIITVFGCGGNRDNAKRSIMGRIAYKYSDYVVVTSDNPRYENPNFIIEQIMQGIPNGDAVCIENRKQAISHAIDMAEANDIILLAGKGHETYQEINGVKHPFDEKVIVAELLNQRDYS